MDDNNNDDLRPWEQIPEDYDHNPTGWAVITTPIIEEAKRWERHIAEGKPYRTSYEARMRHFLALCARGNLRATAVQLVIAFRCGYWAAAGDPVAMPQQDLAAQLGMRKQTLGRLVRAAVAAWHGIERDDSASVYETAHFDPENRGCGGFADRMGTHNGLNAKELPCDTGDPLAEFREFGIARDPF